MAHVFQDSTVGSPDWFRGEERVYSFKGNPLCLRYKEEDEKERTNCQ